MKTFYVGPAAFYEFHCEEKLVDDILIKIKDCDWLKTTVTGKDNLFYAGYDKFEDGNLSFYDENLYTWLHECLDQVAAKHFEKFKLKVVDLWATKAEFGQAAITHDHAYSMFSGVLYLSSCKRSQTVFYYEDHFNTKWKFFLAHTKENRISVEVAPEKGKLIIWPSDIVHKVNPHVGSGTRYSLAFNTFIEGKSNVDNSRLNLKVSNGLEPEDKFYFTLNAKKS